MKFFPLLALLAIGSPALANDTFSVVTTDRHTFTVQRNNVECKEIQAMNDNRKNFICSAYLGDNQSDHLGFTSAWKGC